MNYSLGYLCHLVQTKNDLNRRRRRFYGLMNPGHEVYQLHVNDPRVKAGKTYKAYDGDHHNFYVKKPMHKAYSQKEAEIGYSKAQADMRAMTSHMRKVCKELKAKFRWSNSGSIWWVTHEGAKLDEKMIERFANSYRADKVILG